ncbi:MAG: GNAT family N-acetyltransferase [Syntrophaceae bacterium]|nr:GNAT family N-acetyltransferase [Syntrophaceae bacterium]
MIAATPDLLAAEGESPERLASLLKARVEPGWPPGEYDRDAREYFRERLEEGGAGAAGWYVWYALQRGETGGPAVLVGAGGYFGPPGDDGSVEIGFSVMPAWRELGYATEMAGMLVGHAFADGRVQKVVAHASPGNPTSCRVLEKCGFSLVSRDETSGNNRFEVLIPPGSGPDSQQSLRRQWRRP